MVDNLFGPDFLHTRFFDVEKHRTYIERKLTMGQKLSLTLVVVRLMHLADRPTPNAQGVRLMDFAKTVMLGDGFWLEPISVYYRLSDDETIAQLLAVEPIDNPSEIEVSRWNLEEKYRAEYLQIIAAKR